MTELTRAQVLGALCEGWGTYVARFRRLSPAAQAAFLVKQGYARLADLLAHVVAWWREGQQAIQSMLDDPNFQSRNYDVDAFNAQAITSCRDLGELAVIEAFESARQSWLALVAGLPEDAFQNQKIIERLQIELIGHLAEHEIRSEQV
ncbi:MAG: hypothetical protein NT169_11570 [Chloroflexi bacterium]|nr:hypothetical protein [Chloroflexota bacterium]